ncbi:hypothetical protein HUU40_00055 [candidate division KSB1 bacterium]|nr:hypothetical protein [candidate division KSB1 bacterium]
MENRKTVIPFYRKPKGAGVFKSILILAILIATPASAGPILPLIQAAGTWLTATFGATVGAAIAQFGISFVVSGLIAAVSSKKMGGQQQLIRELLQPTSLPVQRFVYGKFRAPGTPAPVRVIDDILYGCFILNSRESAGPFTVYFDKREVEYTGNPYDFSGTGGVASNEPFVDHCNFWIGKGDQVSPPALILSEASEYFESTDGWRGLTVLWVRLDVGGNSKRQERWPATPPEVMVDGEWSLVRDPRTPLADPSYSSNQALCVLDALRDNPIRQYEDENLWLELFEWSADVAESDFPVKGGGNIKRFSINGILAFSENAELETLIEPMLNAGASRLIRVGGRLGMVPATYSAPVMTITDVFTDTAMNFEKSPPASTLVTEVTAKYTSPERMYETASTPVYVIPGAQAEDGGKRRLAQYDLDFISDHRQAQYVAAIFGRRARMKRSWSGTLPASAFDLVACSPVELDFPAPYHRQNGEYEVLSIHPGLDPIGKRGFAMRNVAELRENSEAIYAWNPATDEQDIAFEAFDPNIGGVKLPGDITTVSDASTVLISGDLSVARILFTFAPSLSKSVTAYEWQFKESGGLWQTGGSIDKESLNGSGDIFAFLAAVKIGTAYEIRVRAVGTNGASEWVYSDPVTVSAGSYLAPAPTPISAVGGSGDIAVTFKTPNDNDFRAFETWGANSDDIGLASLIFGPIYAAPNTSFTQVESGLTGGQIRFYFARSFDRNGQASPFSASISATAS